MAIAVGMALACQVAVKLIHFKLRKFTIVEIKVVYGCNDVTVEIHRPDANGCGAVLRKGIVVLLARTTAAYDKSMAFSQHSVFIPSDPVRCDVNGRHEMDIDLQHHGILH